MACASTNKKRLYSDNFTTPNTIHLNTELTSSTEFTPPTPNTDNEVRSQVRRLKPGGSVYSVVQHLANNWLVPLMNQIQQLSLDETGEKTLSNHRPMDYNDEIMKQHAKKLNEYLNKEYNKEMKARGGSNYVDNNNTDGDNTDNLTPFGRLLSNCYTKKDLVKVMKHVIETRPVQFNFVCPKFNALKRDICKALEAAFGVTAGAVQPEEAKLWFVELSTSIGITSNKPLSSRQQQPKAHRRSLQEAMNSSLNKEETIKLFNTLTYDDSIQFPFK